MVDRVKVNPYMITWAREDAGFKLKDLPNSLKKSYLWEAGDENPTWVDLRNLADKYKRPPVFYFMSEPPEQDSDDIIEFRSDEKIEEYTPDLRLEIRKSKYRRKAFININNEIGDQIPNFSKNISKEKNPYKLGKEIRKLLGISFDTQKKWIYNDNGKRAYNHSIFLYEWKEIFASLGILVFETENVEEGEMSGISLYYDECPIIILNGKNNENRRIFTLMHELSHLIMGKSTICDVDKHNKKEAFCNKVAAEILVPKNSLTDENIFFKNGKIDYSGLSHLYGVSKQVIIYRIFDIDKISKEEKNSLISEIEEKNKEERKKQKERNKKSEGGGMSKVLKKKKYEGKPFSRFILDAYENDIISYSKLIRYLDIPADEIELLHEEVF